MTTKQFQEFVIEFIQEQKLVNQRQEETNKVVMQRLDKQEEFNQMILQKVDNIDQRLIEVENDIKDIKSCPTIFYNIFIYFYKFLNIFLIYY